MTDLGPARLASSIWHYTSSDEVHKGIGVRALALDDDILEVVFKNFCWIRYCGWFVDTCFISLWFYLSDFRDSKPAWFDFERVQCSTPFWSFISEHGRQISIAGMSLSCYYYYYYYYYLLWLLEVLLFLCYHHRHHHGRELPPVVHQCLISYLIIVLFCLIGWIETIWLVG